MEEKDEGKVLREVEHWKTIKEGLATDRSQAIGSRESQAHGSGTQPGIADQRVKKRDELGLREGGRLMAIRDKQCWGWWRPSQ